MNAKPIDIITAEGKSHLTKEQIAARRRAEEEMRIGVGKLRSPDYVKADPVAMAKWRECLRWYRDCAFITASDAGHLARYCRAYSEYQNLLRMRDRVSDIQFSPEEEELVVDELEDKRGKAFAKKTWRKIEFLISVGGIISIDAAINKKMDALIKMEDRLFLNPLAKVKNVPKVEKPKEQEPLQQAGFGNV